MTMTQHHSIMPGGCYVMAVNQVAPPSPPPPPPEQSQLQEIQHTPPPPPPPPLPSMGHLPNVKQQQNNSTNSNPMCSTNFNHNEKNLINFANRPDFLNQIESGGFKLKRTPFNNNKNVIKILL